MMEIKELSSRLLEIYHVSSRVSRLSNSVSELAKDSE